MPKQEEWKASPNLSKGEEPVTALAYLKLII